MPVITLQLATPLTGVVVRDTDADATGEDNVRNGATTLTAIDINNADASTRYVKFYNNLDPTIGTTAPDMIIPIAASVRRTVWIVGGYRFATALSFAMLTTAGTAGTTSPTTDSAVNLFVS